MRPEERLIIELIGSIGILIAWLASIYRIAYRVQNHIEQKDAHFIGNEKMRVMAHISNNTIHGSEKEHIENEVRLVRMESKIDGLAAKLELLAKELRKSNGKSK